MANSGGYPTVYGYPAYLCAPSAAATAATAACFAGSETVELASGAIKPVEDVQVGDSVLAYSTKTQSTVYSDVVAVPHAKNEIAATFSHITTESGKDIKMTAEHLVAASVCGEASALKTAASVQVGECVQTVAGEERVVSNVEEAGRGLYTLVTKEDGLLVVNGIVASPFAVNHAVGNTFYQLHRAVYSLAPAFMKTSFFASIQAFVGDLAVFFAK
jgi:Hint module